MERKGMSNNLIEIEDEKMSRKQLWKKNLREPTAYLARRPPNMTARTEIWTEMDADDGLKRWGSSETVS